MRPLFSLRYGQSTDTTPACQQIEAWLACWGVPFQRRVPWRAYDHHRDESFRFQLDFLISPMKGRKPNDYLALEVISHAAPRQTARLPLLRALFPGRILAVDVTQVRVDAEAVQIQILNAL